MNRNYDEELLALARVLARTEAARQALEDDASVDRSGARIVQLEYDLARAQEVRDYRGRELEAIEKCANGVAYDQVPSTALIAVEALRKTATECPWDTKLHERLQMLAMHVLVWYAAQCTDAVPNEADDALQRAVRAFAGKGG